MQDVNDSDVEIKVFDQDGAILSGISEYEEPDLPIEPMMDPTSFPMHHQFQHHIDPSTYYILHHDDYSSSTRKLAKNLCQAPHLYIQQRYSANTTWWMINSVLFIDEYLSFKFFFETSWPILLEMCLVPALIISHHIAVILWICGFCVYFHHIQCAILTLIAWLCCMLLIQCFKSLHILPFRPLPNVIHNDDPYGFNVQRTINIRSLCLKRNDSDISSFPCCSAMNIIIYTTTWYLYTNQLWPFLLIPYVVWSRCYFALNYLFDCILSGAVGLCIVMLLWITVPQTLLIIADEMI